MSSTDNSIPSLTADAARINLGVGSGGPTAGAASDQALEPAVRLLAPDERYVVRLG